MIVLACLKYCMSQKKKNTNRLANRSENQTKTPNILILIQIIHLKYHSNFQSPWAKDYLKVPHQNRYLKNLKRYMKNP